jgi:transposase-like protein
MKTTFEFKTLTDFTDYFCDEETWRKHYTAIRFGNGEYCPHCGHTQIYTFKDGKRYRCASCKQDFTIKTGTVFGESKLPLRKWFIAIYLLSTTSKGISSVQVAKHVGVCQKTAWFMAHRIREAHQQNKGQLLERLKRMKPSSVACPRICTRKNAKPQSSALAALARRRFLE